MSSSVLKHALVCALLTVFCAPVAAKQSQPILSCEIVKTERVALKQAPNRVRRVSKHVLEITSKKGLHQFIDKPPHDEGEIGGVHWRYCGYDAHVKAHLIEMLDESSYSGDFLLVETGQRVHTGHTVLFSPNLKKFLAIKQEAGVDGENWTVRDFAGNITWTGYAGTVANNRDGVKMVVSQFEHPRWTGQGNLTARFVCASSNAQGIVTLVRSPSGSWRWSGHAKCL